MWLSGFGFDDGDLDGEFEYKVFLGFLSFLVTDGGVEHIDSGVRSRKFGRQELT